MFVSTKSFDNNGFIPKKQAYSACGGENISPDLAWGDVPEGVKSFAIVCHDPDAPVDGGWYHWILVNIPVATKSVKEGIVPALGVVLKNDFGEFGYGGPCPPIGHGVHHYDFIVHAIDVEKLDFSMQISPKDADNIIKKHSIKSAVVTGLFER